jgi:hypothetical protein
MSIYQFNRRAFIRAGSTVLALPLMDSLAVEKAAAIAPKRFLMIGCGYGFTKETFYPKEAGRFADIGLTAGLKPLERHQDDISLVSNLTNPGASDAHGGSTSYLTGANVRGTPGKRFHNSISLDQVLARRIGQDTRYPTLTLSDKSTKDGHGSGLSLSWSDKGHPIPGVTNPVDLYHQLFGQDKESDAEREFRLAERRSVLDGMVADLKSSKRTLSKADQDKLEDYLQSIRQIEQSISREVEWQKTPKPKAPLKQPKDGMDGLTALKTFQKLIVAAFQTDSTRVITYRQPINSILESWEFKLGAHSLSHYNLDPRRREASQQKDAMFMELFAGLLDMFKEKQDLNGQSLFDTSLISYGSNLRAGHGLKGCPAIYAGGAAKNLKLGEHIVLPEADTPLCNYWLTLVQESGVAMDQFSHSTGTLSELVG